METHNLSGSHNPTFSRPHPMVCFLRPFAEDGAQFLDAQVLPKTEINVGDEVFHKFHSQSQTPIMHKVAEVVERRPAKGDWSRADVHLDFIRLRFAQS